MLLKSEIQPWLQLQVYNLEYRNSIYYIDNFYI